MTQFSNVVLVVDLSDDIAWLVEASAVDALLEILIDDEALDQLVSHTWCNQIADVLGPDEVDRMFYYSDAIFTHVTPRNHRGAEAGVDVLELTPESCALLTTGDAGLYVNTNAEINDALVSIEPEFEHSE